MREDQVRELLGLAGETIEVGPGAAAEAPARKRWPYVAGAAAAAVAIAASVLVGVTLSGDRDNATPPEPTVALPSPDELPLSPMHYELDEDQVPLLIGWKVDEAKAELASRGYSVEVAYDDEVTCRVTGRVWRTEPAVGRRLEAGGTVRLVLPAADDCVAMDMPDEDLAWRLIDFADGRGPLPPEITGDLTLWLGPRFSRTITAEEARDPGNWVVCSDNGVVCASALHDLVENRYFQSGLVREDGTEVPPSPVAPGMAVSYGPGGGLVGSLTDRAPVLPGRTAVQVVWSTPDNGSWSDPSVDLFKSRDRLSDIATWSGLNTDGSAGVAVPAVEGLDAEHAWEVLLEAGFDDQYDVRASDECGEGRVGSVLGIQPEAGTLVLPSSYLILTLCRTTHISAPPNDSAVGRAFIGSMDPEGDVEPEDFGNRVALYLGNEFMTVIPDHAVNIPEAWDVCPASGSYAERECPFSARDAVRRADPEGIQFTHRHPATPCLSGTASPPDRPGERLLVLGPYEYDCTSAWFVELYYDTDNDISAVNLLIGTP